MRSDDELEAKSRWHFLATLPGITMALLPKFACPICWPLYAGILSSFGISVTQYSHYLMPVMIFLLCIALFALGFRAKQRRGYYPLLLGIIASLLILTGNFAWHSNTLLYSSVIFLVGASLWNAWPKRKNKPSCAFCRKSD